MARINNDQLRALRAIANKFWHKSLLSLNQYNKYIFCPTFLVSVAVRFFSGINKIKHNR